MFGRRYSRYLEYVSQIKRLPEIYMIYALGNRGMQGSMLICTLPFFFPFKVTAANWCLPLHKPGLNGGGAAPLQRGG